MTVRDIAVENEMRGCYGRRNKDESGVKIWFRHFILRIGFFPGGRGFSNNNL